MPAFFEAGTPLNTRLASVSQVKGARLFASHGGQDTMTPVSIGRANKSNYAMFVADNCDEIYHEYPLDPHTIGKECQTDVKAFLASLDPT